MRLTMRLIALGIAVTSVLAVAQNVPFAGTVWKLNPAKSSGRVPTCLTLANGILRLPREIYTGSPSDKPVRQLPAKCADVYKLTWASDGSTMTVTQPQLDANFKAVFDKQ